MAIDRKFIGLESEVRYVDVEKGQLRLFATAVTERNPIYTDEAAARAAGYSSLPAPPTFAFSLGLLAPARIGNVGDMVENIGDVLHAGQSFDYRQLIFAGDRIRLQTRTADIFYKKGGRLLFIVQDTTAHNQRDELCVTSRTTFVVRN